MKTVIQSRLITLIRASTLVLMAVAAVLLATEATAAELSLLGGMEINSASFDTALGSLSGKSVNSINYGVTIDLPIGGSQWSFETGAFYGAHATKLEIDAQNYVQFKQNNLSIPAMVRYHLGPVLSIGVGGYYALSMGNSKSTTTAAGVTGAETEEAKLNNDYGLVGSIKAEFPASSKVRFAVEGRYNMGLKSVDASGTPTKFSDINALGGIVFAL